MQPTEPIVWVLGFVSALHVFKFVARKFQTDDLLDRSIMLQALRRLRNLSSIRPFQRVPYQAILLLALFAINSYSIYSLFHRNARNGLQHEFLIAASCRKNMYKLNSYFDSVERMPSIGVVTAGGNAYAYGGKTIDLMGLTNSAMAHANRSKNADAVKNHASFTVEVFHDLAPDLVWLDRDWFSSTPGLTPQNFNPSEFYLSVLSSLWTDQKFLSDYAVVILRKSNQQELLTIASRDFISKLGMEVAEYQIQIIPWHTVIGRLNLVSKNLTNNQMLSSQLV